jgi:hypothetical protein
MSDTTEMPAFLDERWPAVMSLLEVVVDDEAGGLTRTSKDHPARWYRCHRHRQTSEVF